MSQENFWILLSKKLSNEASSSELKELEQLIENNPQWQYAIQNFEDIWKQRPREDDMLSEDAYLVHLQRMNETGVDFGNEEKETPVIWIAPRKRKWYWAVAASLLVIAGIFAFTFSISKGSREKQLARQVNEISTQPGSRSRVELPDGSIVWLNAGSKLTYNKDFGTQVREVTLSGEGFFDVMKMKDKPFIIHTSSINIKVLGTAFNVKAYPEDKLTETSLIRGTIEVTIRNRPNDKIILSPSEKLVVKNTGANEKEAVQKDVPPEAAVLGNPLVSVDKLRYNPLDSAVAETEWINSRLVFRDETFDDLAVRMERWYDVKIEISDPYLRQARLNGTFQSESVLQALEALTEMIPFRYEKKGNKIIINR